MTSRASPATRIDRADWLAIFAANPDKTNAEIAALAGVTHKVVANARARYSVDRTPAVRGFDWSQVDTAPLRAMFERGVSMVTIGAQIGVSAKVVALYARKQGWVAPERRPDQFLRWPTPAPANRAKSVDLAEARRLFDAGYTHALMAERLKTSEAAVRALVKAKGWVRDALGAPHIPTAAPTQPMIPHEGAEAETVEQFLARGGRVLVLPKVETKEHKAVPTWMCRSWGDAQ